MTLQAQHDNVVSLHAVREQRHRSVAAPVADRRSEPRFVCHERVFVQVVLSAQHPELVGRTFACRAVNLSAGGLHFQTDTALPEDALVDIWIDLSARPGKFFLSGSVRWCREAGDDQDGRCAVGIQLDEGPATDIEEWRDLLH